MQKKLILHGCGLTNSCAFMMSSGCRLLVRKLPNFLRPEDKESLLKFFGAIEVTVMSQNGAMRNCAFATFANPADARMAMIKLHQLNVFGSVLIVVYASPQSEREAPIENRWRGDKVSTSDKPRTESNLKSSPSRKTSPTAIPQLSYEYPPPTQTIIGNIAHAVAAVPLLYTQVLHLMNKLNLPSPFDQPLPAPDLPSGRRRDLETSESELSSSTDGEETERKSLGGRRLSRKRRRKMPKRMSVSFKQFKEAKPIKDSHNGQEATKFHRRIEIKAPDQLRPPANDALVIENVYTFAATPIQQEMETSQAAHDAELNMQEESPLEEDFISYAELQLNRISNEEMERDDGVFKNYSKGEPSMRLYIKNLSKQATEKDLTRIYGRYINWSSEVERHSFDVRVMQQGRMKGQAFIGMPNEEITSKALADTLGYKLYDKPMVVQFARSTKAKEKETWQT
ncbi:PREDICTED: RNA-binding protein 40-like isoform X2 [Amphimedon queenslandica]|uniref:RNA-binding region-containing protein 3 n=2 Tax=Amphimedon queenslandica TaxID=400682 RepID=A0AAN0JQW5_AMPQE|nr:PREDICTED: RNA-binding protein 40-like isoform X2 [Amphimedon queenslandica]|eukprot:XP_019859224.1 PREDICTED: RNA-binding protein 40-like isoform X2 [Amphimedon queenslandica]